MLNTDKLTQDLKTFCSLLLRSIYSICPSETLSLSRSCSLGTGPQVLRLQMETGGQTPWQTDMLSLWVLVKNLTNANETNMKFKALCQSEIEKEIVPILKWFLSSEGPISSGSVRRGVEVLEACAKCSMITGLGSYSFWDNRKACQKRRH